MKRLNNLPVCFVVLLAVGCSKEAEQKSPPAKEPTPSVAAPGAAQGKGAITGKIVFKGSHSPGNLSVGKDREVCGDAKRDPSLLVGSDGGLTNAVVQIAGLREGAAPNKDAAVDQAKCEYVPHVSVVPAGATVTFKNSDGILHNIHTVSQINSPFNRAQPKFLKEIKETFAKPEIIGLRCDVHGWMTGWVVVTDNVFFGVTESDGAFNLTDVPAGKHNLEIWHEKLGSLTQSVEIKPGETAKVIIEFQAKK
jgi:plastocyanin